MFICRKCAHIFETGPCSWCGSEEYDDAAQCGRCGDWCAAGRLREGFCPNCQRVIWRAFSDAFDEDEQAYIALRL